MKSTLGIVAFFMVVGTQISLAHDVKILGLEFPGPNKPRTEIDRSRDWAMSYFSASAGYWVQVELDAQVPHNTAFNVRAYAIIKGKQIPLGDARVGRGTSIGHLFVTFHIFPAEANYRGKCDFLFVVDADNEISESNESALSNEWKSEVTLQ